MLPLWRDQLRIGFAPGKISLVRIGKGLRPSIKEKQVVKCEEGADSSWQEPLDTLAKSLTQKKWQNADAAVFLSNHFVRYQIVPWSTEISGEQEQAAFVKHCFSKVFGDDTNNWELRYSEAKAGEPGVASALEKALLGGLEQTCLTAKLRLRSVQPCLMPAFNQHRHLFDADSACFVLVERGKLCISMFRNRIWQSVATKLISKDDWITELPLLLDRQWRLANLDNHPGKVFLLALGQPELALPKGDHWTIQQLRCNTRFGLTPKDASRYGLVLGDY